MAASPAMNNEMNPLTFPILEILQNAQAPLSEHQLMGLLQQPLTLIKREGEAKQLALYRAHFLVMNALYQLQERLLGEGYRLSISPLNIRLSPSANTLGNAVSDEALEGNVGRFYLDWANYEKATAEDVDALLEGFWQRYWVDDKQLASYQSLELEPGVAWKQVVESYRRLVAHHHPDKGGDTTRFVKIREAYEVLSKVHGQ